MTNYKYLSVTEQVSNVCDAVQDTLKSLEDLSSKMKDYNCKLQRWTIAMVLDGVASNLRNSQNPFKRN